MTTEMKQIDADKLAAEIAGLSAPDLRKLLLVEVRQHEDTKCDLEAARAEAAEGEANGRAEAEARLGAVIRENNAGIENLRDDLEASAATAELYRTAAEQAAKERDEALNVAHAQAHAAVEDMRLQRDEARRERDLVGQSFERAGAELLRIEADRDEARALAKDALDTRDRMAVEVQALREALRRIGALHSETRTGIRGEPKGETWSAFADRLQREAAAALSAPSESERVLAARDERTRADERARVAAALNAEGHRLRESSNDSEQWGIADGHLRAALLVESHPIVPLAATPPSAASGKAEPDDEPEEAPPYLCIANCGRRVKEYDETCPTCAASGKGAT
jgi:hypothetical protein